MNDNYKTPRTQVEAGLHTIHTEDPITQPLFGPVEWFLLGTGFGMIVSAVALWLFP